ncbi:MAG: HTH domain-containing protein [Bradymonadales bacterium]|jgi:hypothetical protein
MTFFEAALEVLRSVKRPLHFRKIAELAISRGLLGHVGNAPIMTMGIRLLQEVRRKQNDSPLLTVAQGIFALRAWSKEILEIREESSQEQALALPLVMSQEGVETEELNKEDVALLLRVAGEAVQASLSVERQSEVQSSEELSDPHGAEASVEQADALQKEELSPKTRSRDAAREHYNVAAASVKMLRSTGEDMTSEQIAQSLNQRFSPNMTAKKLVLALRADNCMRSERGKRPLFRHIAPNSWRLTERDYTRAVLRAESRIYDLARQLRTLALQSMLSKLRALDTQAWLQLGTLLLRQLNYTIISQVQLQSNAILLRAEEARGINYMSVLVLLHHGLSIDVDEVLKFRKMVQEHHLQRGVIITNAEFTRDAVVECDAQEMQIIAYSARQCASIMLEARIGIHNARLPLFFINHRFFDALQDETEV